MRRAVLTLGGTVAGLIALFSYKTHVPGITPVAEPGTPAALSATAPPMTTGSGAASSPKASSSKRAAPTASAAKTTAPATTQPTSAGAPTTQAPATQAPTTTPTSAKPTPTPTKTTSKPTPTPTPTQASPQTFQGSSVNTQYGPVQVAITVSGGKITNAGDTQQPSDSIGVNAVQQLNQEVLTAQSANIQAVSGATYTSNGYIQSLQQAVDQAGL